MLELKNVHTYYGNIHAIEGRQLDRQRRRDCDADRQQRRRERPQRCARFKGLLRPREGSITLRGEELTKLPAHEVVTRGISQSPEGRLIFSKMTVRENLEMGAYQRKDRQNMPKDMEHVSSLFPRLRERMTQRGGTLSGGEQQMLSMGRALMARPKIMLLDEPSMGLAPILVDQIFDIIRALNNEGTTILLVEQNARIALGIANRGYVLETGEIVLTGEGKKLLDNPQVKAAYLGEGH